MSKLSWYHFFVIAVVAVATSVALLIGCGGGGGGTTPSPETTTTTLPSVSAPVISPASGTYEANSLTITITCTTSGTSIYYTTEGYATTASTPYTGSFSIDASKTVNAITVKSGYSNGNASANYKLYWWQPLSSEVNGINDDLYALSANDYGSLYAGGGNGVYKWGELGTALSTLEDEMHQRGSDIRLLSVVFDGDTIFDFGYFPAEGNFLNGAGYYIAEWRSAAPDWTPPGDLFDGHPGTAEAVSDLVTAGYSKVYACGTFTTREVAMFDGTKSFYWSYLGSGVDGAVNALALDGSGNLYVGGSFTHAGGKTANRIAKWDGTSWEALGGGVDGTVTDVAVNRSGDDLYVYAYGSFTHAGGKAANHIAKWDGATWDALGSGVSNVDDLTVDNEGNLFVCGSNLTSAGGVTVNHVAKWNGSAWSKLGNGIGTSGDYIRAVSCGHSDYYGNYYLYVGGTFTNASGVTVKNIAKWGKK